MRYEEYLRSPEWRAKREWALERAGHRCQVCNSGENLHVHHRTYENRGAELPADLTVLCSECHELFHAKVGQGVPASKKRIRLVDSLDTAERRLLTVLVGHREAVEWAAAEFCREDFKVPAHWEVFSAFVRDPELMRPPPGMDPVASRLLEELLGDEERFLEPSRAAEECLAQMKCAPLTKRAEEIREALRGEKGSAKQEELLRELQDIDLKRRELQHDWLLLEE